MTLIQKVLACSVLTGAGIAGYKYLNQKPKTFKPVKVITDNARISKYTDNYSKSSNSKKSENIENFKKFFEKNDSGSNTSFVTF